MEFLDRMKIGSLLYFITIALLPLVNAINSTDVTATQAMTTSMSLTTASIFLNQNSSFNLPQTNYTPSNASSDSNITLPTTTTTTLAPPTSPPFNITWPKISNTTEERELMTNRRQLEEMLKKRYAKIQGSASTFPPPLGSRVEYFKDSNGISYPRFITDVEILVYVSRIDYMDMDSQSLTFAAKVTLQWRDLHLVWDRKKDSPLYELIMNIQDIWNPYILPEDIQDFLFIPDNNQVNNAHHKVRVQYTGQCVSVFWATFTVPCGVTVMTFPFDTHRCHLHLSQFHNFGEEINFLPIKFENNSARRTALYNRRHAHREWTLVNLIATIKEQGTVYALQIDLRRKSVFYAVVLIMPCIILNILSFLIFIVPVDGTGRIDLSLNLILSYFVLLMIMIDSLPPSGSQIPLLGMYLSTSTAILLTNLAASLVLMKLYKINQKGKPVPRALKIFARKYNLLTCSCDMRNACLICRCCPKKDPEEPQTKSRNRNGVLKQENCEQQIKNLATSSKNGRSLPGKSEMEYVIENLNKIFMIITVFGHLLLMIVISVLWDVLWFQAK